MAKIQYSTIELAKITQLEGELQKHTNPEQITGFERGFERKSYFGKSNADFKVTEGAREFVATITTNMRDRDNEIVKTDGIDLKWYRKNPVVLWAHDYMQPPIGRASWIKTYTDPADKTHSYLVAKAKLAEGTPRAEEILRLMQQEILNTVSIGFISIAGHVPTEEEIKDDKSLKEVRYIHDKVALLEFSIVSVPANPEATIEAVSKGEVEISTEMQKALGLYVPPNTPVISKKAVPYLETPRDGIESGWILENELSAATLEDLAVMAAWMDTENKESRRSYKLIHHRSEASHPLVYDGLMQAMSNLQTRAVKIPDHDREDVYKHLARHFREFGKEPPEFMAEPEKFATTGIKTHQAKALPVVKANKPIPAKPANIQANEVIPSKAVIDGKQIEEDAIESFAVNVLGRV